MTAAPMVLVAPLERVAGLVARLDAGAELLTFADTDALDALATITERHPSVIVIERFFAATPRGAALINRIKNDATLSGVEIRVLSDDNDHVRTIATAPPRAGADDGPVSGAPSLDYHGTRRAARFTLRAGVDIKVDGDPATVIDMSSIGAQVVLGRALRPYQRVRVSLETASAAVRCRAAIAWCRFELRPGKDSGGFYRAGVEFESDADALDSFCLEHAEPVGPA